MERFIAKHNAGKGKFPLVLLLYVIQKLNVLILQTFKHIFTSPSSVEREAKATRSGNARIHGMTSVTCASIAYAATQVRFLSTPFIYCRMLILFDTFEGQICAIVV